MSNDNNMNTKDFLIGALVGGLVGAASALLLAPKSGKELREDLNNQALTAKEKTSGFTQTALEKGSQYAHIAKEKSTTIAKTVSEQSSQLVDRVKELTDSVRRDVEELSQSADDLTANFEEAGIEIANTVKAEVAELHEEILQDEKVSEEEVAPTRA
ncbi:YtxH domain-containing protein [Anaerobacillus sp. CMMVII]|uniref:YtxH domain-containing protein n=1 Tax=Anaerobacillus sp. CMMVII TaxID=2755588 RepID=UPI0021B7CE0C|nr:YtxH domain-containing protein [Anaerobacillus sp. CMMVII]MCT8137343.1 YtxH domain-containing protein [Anaerobacillus sp. CMMVII]